MNATAHIVALLKRKPCTYAEMMAPGGKIISTCPHKRVKEWLGSAANDAPMPVQAYMHRTGQIVSELTDKEAKDLWALLSLTLRWPARGLVLMPSAKG